MKKGKVLGKGHIAVALMVVALGAAVWLNMKFSSQKYFGEAKYVDNSSAESVATAAKADAGEADYFETAVKEREEALLKAEELVEETLKGENITDEQRENALGTVKALASRIEKESNIETLLKGKGFEKAVAVIGDKGINIVVKSDGLTTAQTLQIQDIVTGETDIGIGNIKIVAVK